MTSMKKLRVAVIGSGNMGRHHVRNYSILPEFDLVAIADINPSAKALADEHKAKYYKNYEDMIDGNDIDAVSIVVPTPLHYEVASFVMERGIHCMLEKPIASTVEEANKLINLSNDKKVVFTIGHIERYNPLIRKLKLLVDEGRVGKITSIVCKRVGGFPSTEPKTDVIIDLAVHDIDITSYILGKQPKRIYSHGSRTHHSKEVDSTEILMDYGEASGFVQANWLTPVKVRTIAVTGSKGFLEGNYITQELEVYRHNMKKEPNEDFSSFVIDMGEPEKDVIKVDFEEPLAVELKAFASAIHKDPALSKPGIVKPEDARDALELALEAIIHHRNNNGVKK